MGLRCRSRRSPGSRHRPRVPETSPFDELPPLAGAGRHGAGAPKRRRSSPKRCRAALCASRPGRASSSCSCRRCARLEHFVELVGVVEEAAAKLGLARRPRGLPPAFRPAAGQAPRHAGPGSARGQCPPGFVVAGAGRHHHRGPRRRPRHPARHRDVPSRRCPRRHRRRQPPDPRAARPGRQPPPAPARPAAAASSLTGSTIRRSRTCSRAGSSALPARPPGSTRPATRASTSSRSPSPSSIALTPCATGETGTALAGGPVVPAPARRHHGQHPPGRAVHRQAVQPRLGTGPPGAARAAWLRDAAPPPHGARAGAVGPGPGRPLLGRRRMPARWCAGAPSSTTASSCRGTPPPTSPRW